jgi:uncharacterized OB-fold protein
MTDKEAEFGDPTTAPFWDACRQHRLIVQRCRSCQHHQFYPRPFCLGCYEPDPEWVDVKGTGTIYSQSEVHVAPSPEFATPYVVAVVELDEGPRLMTNIVNGVSKIGDRVKVVWDDRTDTPPIPLFELTGT